ncbi:MAG: thioredoxin family protein [Bacteroidetes bacterium]|nr:thioredoxin family protein [Bacteroidota bacterium]
MRNYIIILLFCLPFGLLAQDPACNALLRKPLAFDLETKNWNQDVFLEEAAQLIQCFFNEEEKKYLTDKPFHNFLIHLSANDWDHQPTHSDMLDYFQGALKARENRKTEGETTFGNTLADTVTWEQDILKIRAFKPSDELLDGLYELVVEYQGRDRTYGELIDLYQARVEAPREILPPFRTIDGSAQEFAWKKALEMAQQQGRLILVYFSSRKMINCKKIEENILSREDIQERLSKYICLQLMVDDQTPLKPAYQFKTDKGKTIRTIGGRNMQFQLDKFNTYNQPYFAILDPEGNLLFEGGYTSKPEMFYNFLGYAFEQNADK